MSTDQELKQRLKNCSTLNEMFKVWNEYYDLDTPLGNIVQPMVVTQLTSKMQIIATTARIKRRK